MRKILLMLMVAFFGLALVAVDAEARRMGGGKSLGKQNPSYSRQATPPQQQSQQAAPTQRQSAQSGAGTSGASRWLGPLAGLAAGGLLAALLFGDAFEGFQFLDFLLLAGLAFLGFMLFKAMRARSVAATGARRYAPAGSSGGPAGFETPEIGSGLGGGSARSMARPAWFNEEEFLRAAKTHFIRLQAAWDKGDMKDIREYTTPELYAELALERQQLDNEAQFTEVVSLNAELLDVLTQGGLAVASVRYSGLIREAHDAEPQAFSEIWHIQRDLDEPQANWYVAGIQQEELPER